jgi:hypothetical protein
MRNELRYQAKIHAISDMPRKKITVSILASFCVRTKSLMCKGTVNWDSTCQSIFRRLCTEDFRFPGSRPDEVAARPNAYLSTVPSVRTTCHTVRTPDSPASSVRTTCSFRPDPLLYREASVPAWIRPDDSASRPDASQRSISFRFFPSLE